MPKKTVRKNGSPKRAPVRKTVGAKQSDDGTTSRGWKKALERNLILEGYSRAEAKELVALSAK